MAYRADVRLARAADSSGDPIYRVMVSGKQVGLVWRHEGTSRGYWGAWRGCVQQETAEDAEDGIYACGKTLYAESRAEATGMVIARQEGS